MFGNRSTRHAAPGAVPPGAYTDTDALDDSAVRAAYRRGRDDERRARKRHPVLMTLTVCAALVGGAVLALAAMEGSFAGAGDKVDTGLNVAAERAEPAVREAASDAGAAISSASDKAADTTRPDAG